MSATEVSIAERDWFEASLTDLVDHIESRHHNFLRRALPRLSDLMDELLSECSGEPKIRECRDLVASVRLELEAHLAKEEGAMFPLIRELDRSTTPIEFPCGSLRNPIGVMEHEHDSALCALAELRELTDHYTPPGGASELRRRSLSALAELEADLLLHIRKENGILFPRSILAESDVDQ